MLMESGDIDFTRCNNDRDMITQIEWTEEKPTLFIIFHRGGKEFIECFIQVGKI